MTCSANQACAWVFPGVAGSLLVSLLACASSSDVGHEQRNGWMQDAALSEDGSFGADARSASSDAWVEPDGWRVDGGDPPLSDDDAGVPDAAVEPEPPVDNTQSEVEMTYATVNIGRAYKTKSDVQGVINKVGNVIGPKSGPQHIGWQEIGEGDPCGGSCEIEAVRNRFKASGNWVTRHPRGKRPDGALERVKVPVTTRGNTSVRATFASPGWAGVSPTRFVTVTYLQSRNVSLINTHFIAGAWSCKSNVAKRRDYWRRAWQVLKSEVKKEIDKGRNVIVTGDLNRPRGANNCNPKWDPSSLHARARVVGGSGIDYIFAVSPAGTNFTVSKRADGTAKRGSIALGIDSHKGHWVSGRFR